MKKKSLVGGLPNRTSSVEKIPVAKNVSLSPESRERNQTVSVVKKTKKKSLAGGLPNRTSSVEKIP
eukprot:scaffold8_cov60-Cylindrotheca_fusiformis.AAC.1